MPMKPLQNPADHEAPDLNALFVLAREKSKAGRRALFATVKDLFFENGGALTERERALMGDILRKLIADVEILVRKDLAERLAKRADAPRELVVALANDEFEVAYPLLKESTLLHDADLIEIIRHRTQAHQVAVATRKGVSEQVSETLVGTGDTDVIATLLDNGDAAISRSVMEYLVAESKRVDRFQMPLVNRRDLPSDLARKMCWWVSAALRQHIVANYDVDPTAIDDSIEETVKDALDTGEADAGEPSEAERVAAEMGAHGRLTEAFLTHTLRQGEVPLFEACFARAIDLKLKLTRRLLYEPGGEALALACKAAGFKRATFTAIFLLARKGVVRADSFETEEISRAADFFDRVNHDHAISVVKRWRRDADYLHALRRLEDKG